MTGDGWWRERNADGKRKRRELGWVGIAREIERALGGEGKKEGAQQDGARKEPEEERKETSGTEKDERKKGRWGWER